MMLEDQSEVIAFLSDPATHGGVAPVECIETHASVVFLAGERAYKLKRAVRYEYLDYSTCARRRDACQAEVQLNSRTAPTLYIETLPITRAADATLRFGGDGPLVDTVVAMRRFPQDALLDQLAERKMLSLADAARVADVVADYHAHAGPRRAGAGAAVLEQVIEGNIREMEAAGELLDTSLVAAVAAVMRELVRRYSQLLDERRMFGSVRQCHGDLHLRNIVMVNGIPTLFDAVEFNSDFSAIDVLYDVAFLIMDLLARGLPTHANVVFSRYLLQTGDLEGLRLFPLFLATRATVRVKTSLAARALASDAERMRELTTRARQYLQLAEELLTPTPPRLIAIGGYSGVGKSTLARELAPLVGVPPGAVVLRTDELRRRRFAAWSGTMPQWAYAVEMRRKVYSELREQALRVLRTGYAVVADGVFNELIERRALVQIAKRADVPFAGVWLDADRAILQQRLLARQEDISDATGVVLEQQMARPLRRLRWPVVNAGGAPEETLQATEHALTESITDGRRLIDHMRRAL